MKMQERMLWPELLKEVAEIVYRRKISNKEIEEMSDKQKRKLISENHVQTTCHFQKRMEKLFSIMGYDFFQVGEKMYHVSSYFFRIEYQQRGSTYVHSLLWLKDRNLEDAPSFWYSPKTEIEDDQKELMIKKIEELGDFLLSTCSKQISCQKHQISQIECVDCNYIQEKVKRYQTHCHSFTCKKKRKCITIRENEGHGRMDGFKKGKNY